VEISRKNQIDKSGQMPRRSPPAESPFDRLRPPRTCKTVGFTLIELLVVVSIIALLVSILLPSLAKARESAKRAVCLSNQRHLIIGLMVYATDNDDRFPSHGRGGANAGTNYYLKNPYTGFSGLGRLYNQNVIDDEKIFYCPSQRPDSFFCHRNGWSEGADKPNPWNDLGFEGYRWGSYIYRIFDQHSYLSNDTGIMTRQYVEYISNLRYTQIKGRMALLSDPPYANLFANYGFDMITWAHHMPPYGVNAAYADGSANWVDTGKERYETSTDWLDQYPGSPDDYAVLFFKALDNENFRELDEAYINVIVPLL
jgi:prepilin-type N-terminal cleavage/methylation domain-containing protein